MTQKVRKVLIMVVMAALILCLMAASLTYTFTYGRYAGNDFNADDSPYDDLIEFVGSREYTVRTPEELIQAIEDGYSNIQIAVDAEEPFVITEGVTDVSANLVLDLNGKVVVRNSRNPLLDVQTNVSVVLVYDSSKEGQGAFYNPVGSSLQASGGTLTVGSGNYEDGPRADEYNTDTSQITSATLVTRDARTSTSYGNLQQNVAGLPKISANHYFAEGAATGNFNSICIEDDTFLIYTLEDDCMIDEGGTLITGVQTSEDGTQTEGKALTVPCNVASCDFYYYYHIGDNPKTTDVTEENTYAVIYGYWDVMALAEKEDKSLTSGNDTNLIWPYAAVRMVDGEGFARGGNFKNNFNAVNTYGIYATDGRLAVSQVPVTNDSIRTNFTTGGDGVCIRVSSSAGSTTGGDEGGGTLDISGGSFSSEIGNTIEMQGGTMNVTAGKFTKSGGKGIGSGSGEEQAQQQRDNQTAIIDMQGGTLNINGSASNSVTMTAGGTVTNPDGTVTDNGGTLTNVFGILAHSGGEVSVGGCTFNINGNYSAGVLSYDGTINLKDNTFINVTEEHPDRQLTSAGVSSERDTSTTSTSTDPHPINMNGSVTITSNGLGITARGMINVQSGTTTVKTENATGIVVSGDADETDEDRQATLTVESNATLSVESTINSFLKWVNAPGHEGTGDTNVNNGIYVENGSIDASAGTLNVTHTGVAGDAPANSTTGAATKSYAVFVKGDAEGGSQETTVSIGKGSITGTSAGGVYVVGKSKQEGDQTTYTATVTLGGVEVTAQNTYAAGILTETGNVIIDGNTQITSSALGIAVIDGNVGISDNSTDSSVTATRATGVYVRGGTLYNLGTLSVESDLADENNNNSFYGNAGADISTPSTDPNPYNGVYVKGGSLDSKGTLNVTFTGVQNAAFNTETQEGKVNTSYLNQQIKSYAVRVDNGNAIIVLGEIKNGVGGGVLVNGGTVELGAVDAENDDLIVSTTGSNYDDQTHYVTGNQWQYDWTLTGGHAVAVEGGTLNIYSGTYTAQMGNGILVRNLASDSTQNTVTVKDGIFEGYNGSGRRVGPGAFYALKVMGGPLTLNINGGTFGKALVNDEVPSTNGGAFVMGNPDAKKRATVNVTNASFNSYNSDTFAVFRYVDASFGSSEGTGNVSMTVTKDADEGSDFAAIGVQNDLVYNNDAHSDRRSTITIASGSYTGGFGIWYGSSTDTVNISDGTFTGTARPGLYFAVDPGSNVTLSGGLYQGRSGAIDAGDQASPRDIITGNIIANNAYCFNQYVDGQGDANKAYAICNREYNWWDADYDNYHVGGNGGNEDVRLNDTTYINGSNGQAFNRRTIIFISNKNGYVTDYTTSI